MTTTSPVEVTPIDLDDTDPQDLLALYADLVRLRAFEDRVYQLFLKGELPGTVHQYQGQEAVAVGTCRALGADDWITSTHRPHGHALAKGVTMRSAMAELYGRATGCCGGKGGSMHLGDPAVGMVPAIAIVAGGVSIVTGMGLAFALQRSGQVAACFFGEGATNEGAFHEGVNLAAVQRLPIVYVCENNLYGASTPFHRTSLVTDVAARMTGYGIPATIVDGMDVLAVRDAVATARERALAGEGPTLIEAKTYRFAGHSRGDARRYRTRDEETDWRRLDPIERIAAALALAGLLDDAGRAEVAAEVAADAPASAGESPVATAPAAPETAPADEVATVVEEPAACIEVVVEGPEGGVARGEEITLRLSVRNTGTAAARAVTPMFHFGRGIEPRGAAGRVGTVTRKGSVVFESLPELAPGECLEVDVVAVCEHTGAVPFRAAVWCGEGDAAEEIPLDGELRVVPGPIASAPGRGTVR